MNNLDIILNVILCFGLVRGFLKGFIWELASLVSVILGIYGAIHFSFYIFDFLKETLHFSEKTIQILAFILTFFIIIILVGITAKLITKILEKVELGLLNRGVGAVFGLLKWSVITGTSLLYLSKGALHILPEKVVTESVLYQPVTSLNVWVKNNILELNEKYFQETKKHQE